MGTGGAQEDQSNTSSRVSFDPWEPATLMKDRSTTVTIVYLVRWRGGTQVFLYARFAKLANYTWGPALTRGPAADDRRCIRKKNKSALIHAHATLLHHVSGNVMAD